MLPQDVKTAADAMKIIEERGVTHIKVGLFDTDGVMRGKYISKQKFTSALETGLGFCDVVLGWDSNDQLYDNVTFTGWHTAFPDAPVRILPETCREIPFEPNTLLFLCEFAGKAEELCPRGVLRRSIERARSMGFEPYAALEYEFFLFDETPHSVREKGYRNLKNITPGFYGYSTLRNSVWADFHHQFLEMCERMRMPIEGLHTETGPGVLEAAIGVDKAMEAGDKANLFKTFAKVLAQRHNMMATFMAKWSRDWPGQSGHVHISLKDKKGGSAFHDSEDPHGMTVAMKQFVAGQRALMPQLLAMVASTVNSYTRLIPGFWAPTHATWGVENRTTALRVIPGSPKSQRVEYRIAAADANPYLALAVALASGLWGIENELELPPPVKGNSYAAQHPETASLPATLWEAAQWLKASKAARALFGDAFVEHYAASREWEERESRKHISDWQLQRYFEII
ncbi:MAG TPA: glutamine synthetase [Alphaproteobacteria bacterium]|nr:glutamine synthetase [Alphaproteobacteria bacterium]